MSANKTIDRTACLKRISFAPERVDNRSAEQLVREALHQLSAVKDRRFARGLLEHIQCNSFFEDSEGVYLHGIVLEQGSLTSAVEKSDDKPEAAVVEVPAPENTDFLQKDVALFISGNHVVLSTTESAMSQSLLNSLIEKTHGQGHFVKLTKAASSNTIRQINKSGIRSVALDITTYLAAFSEVRLTAGSALGSVMKTILGRPASDSDIVKSSTTHAMLTIFKGRATPQVIDQDWLTTVGRETAQDDEIPYTLILRNGNKITSDQLCVTRKISIRRHGKSFACTDAWGNCEKLGTPGKLMM